MCKTPAEMADSSRQRLDVGSVMSISGPCGQDFRIRIEAIAATPAATGVDVERERQAEYCRVLCKTVLRYLTREEVVALGESLEVFAAKVEHARPAQGLHDATYHLRLKFKINQTVQESRGTQP